MRIYDTDGNELRNISARSARWGTRVRQPIGNQEVLHVLSALDSQVQEAKK